VSVVGVAFGTTVLGGGVAQPVHEQA